MQLLKNPTRDRKAHQLTVYSCQQNLPIATALQSARLVPCLPSTPISSGDTPMQYENFILRMEPTTGNPLNRFEVMIIRLLLGAPAEGFVHPMDETKMVTNIDARSNARNHYDHHIVKFKFHDVNTTDSEAPLLTDMPPFSHMAQSHKKSTAERWLQDYLGMV